jgi:hypothetical protein
VDGLCSGVPDDCCRAANGRANRSSATPITHQMGRAVTARVFIAYRRLAQLTV